MSDLEDTDVQIKNMVNLFRTLSERVEKIYAALELRIDSVTNALYEHLGE